MHVSWPPKAKPWCGSTEDCMRRKQLVPSSLWNGSTRWSVTTTRETQRFLHDVILLCVPANPDGQELVAKWYMRNPDPKKRTLTGMPRLYQKYAGHDDNRDFYMSNLPETSN